MFVFESTMNVFSSWNQMAEALSTAASICAVRAFGCSSVPAVLSFPQAVRTAVASGRAVIEKLANAAVANDKILYKCFIILPPILCTSAGTVAS